MKSNSYRRNDYHWNVENAIWEGLDMQSEEMREGEISTWVRKSIEMKRIRCSKEALLAKINNLRAISQHWKQRTHWRLTETWKGVWLLA